MHRRRRQAASAEAARRPRSRRRTLTVAALVALALAVGGWFLSRLFVADTAPEFTKPHHIVVVYEYPDNGGQAWGGRFDARVSHDSAKILVIYEDGRTGEATLSIGDTATIAGITVTLCDTWVAPFRLKFTLESGTDFDNLSTAYLVQSTDGTTPVCPERTN